MDQVRRKLVLSTWKAPKEGNIYGKLTVNADIALRYLEYRSQKTDNKLTITHFVGCCIARSIQKTPTINGFIRWGNFVPHQEVSISFLVALQEGKNLANTKVSKADGLNIEQMASAIRSSSKKLRKGKDAAFQKSQKSLRFMPNWLIRPLLWFSGWATSSLGVSLPMLGLESFPFGVCMITSVGMFGLDEAFAPHTPFARVPIIVLIGAIRKTPIVKGDEIVIAPMMTMTATIDHRYIDGVQGAMLAKHIRHLFENPWECDNLDAPPEDFHV